MKKKDLNFKLIEIVKKHECLYNMHSPQYKQFAYKDRVWTKIGSAIGKKGPEAKKKWKSLRDNFKRCKKLPIGDNVIRRPYKYAEALRFLDDFPTSRYNLLITPASADAEVSTDLSSEEDFQPPAKNELENSFDDMQEFFEASTTDENSKTEFFNIDANTMQGESSKNNETSTIPHINIGNGDCILSSEEQEEKDFTDRLIDEVKKNECIYNMKSADYKNFQLKKRLWHRIGKRVGLSGDAASRKWKSLKDSYRKYKIKCIGDSDGFVRQYKYAETLKFLDDYFSYRPFKHVSNILITPASADAEVSTDLSSEEDFQPSAKLTKNELVNSFDDKQEFFEASTTDENSKTEFFNIDANTMQGACSKNNKNSTIPQINVDNSDCILSSEEQEEKDFIDRLIDEVKKNECIYNMKSADYKNFQLKKRLWYKIGKRVGLSGDAASRKWKSLRDSYRKYKIKCIGDSDGFVRQYKYAESLKFLDDYFSYRPFTKRENKSLSDAEISTDLSSDYDSMDVFSTDQKHSESSSVTSRLFQLLANKIDDTDLTPQEKNDIEYTVSSLVYSKLAEYNKNKINVIAAELTKQYLK